MQAGEVRASGLPAVGLRVRWLLRHHLLATVGLALAAGLTAGLALAAWTDGHRTAAVLDRFLDRTDLPELAITFCPPDVVTLTPEDLPRCIAYDPEDELVAVRGLPGVTLAVRQAFLAGAVTLPGAPGSPQVLFFGAMGDPGMETPIGHPVVVDGRLARPDAADEVVVNEVLQDRYGLAVGDVLDVTFLAAGDEAAVGARPVATGPRVELAIVGVVRTFDDLSAAASGTSGSTDSGALFTGPGVWRATEGASSFFSSIAVQTEDGDAAAARAAVEEAFVGRPFNDQYSSGDDDLRAVRDAFGYEATAAYAVAVLVALAAVVFVGQVVARQSRREWHDLATFRAIGLSACQATSAAVLRGVVTGLGAGVLAVVLAVALVGGHARRRRPPGRALAGDRARRAPPGGGVCGHRPSRWRWPRGSRCGCWRGAVAGVLDPHFARCRRARWPFPRRPGCGWPCAAAATAPA